MKKLRPTYVIIYNTDKEDEVVREYCTGFGKKELGNLISNWCTCAGNTVLVVDHSCEGRVVSVNKERALKIMAKYVEENQ